MYLKSIELSGFKSFAKKSILTFSSPIAGVVGPNGSGKSNTAEAFRFVLGEQSMKAMRGKRGADLIWAGNDRHPQAHRARVALTFDNSQHLFDIDFEEITLERIVYRDGAHEYFINGSKVRLKDIVALLAKAHIGVSGHHIISQGEADRILGATPKERREMIEEALGLKTYHYKKEESEKKLETTEKNMQEARLLQREIRPELERLNQQMQQLERVRLLKRGLIDQYTTYIGSQRLLLNLAARTIENNKKVVQEEVNALEEACALQTDEMPPRDTNEESVLTQRFEHVTNEVHQVTREIQDLIRARGRCEGTLEALHATSVQKSAHEDGVVTVPYVDVVRFGDEVEIALVHAAKETEYSSMVRIFTDRLEAFLQQFTTCEDEQKTQDVSDIDQEDDMTKQCDNTERELAGIVQELKIFEQKATRLQQERAGVLEEMQKQQQAQHSTQEQYFELKAKLQESQHRMKVIEHEEENLKKQQEQLQEIVYRAQDRGISHIPQPIQVNYSVTELHDKVREIDRIEARLEEAGDGIDEGSVQRAQELRQRTELIEREITDLQHSKQSLVKILDGLDTELSERFADGLEKINTEFQTFFTMLFDGGTATLKNVQKKDVQSDTHNEKVQKEGIEVHVQLPRKKATTLEVLSGGERALTSIALIFAMSQVTPPPFIILDETDAALDEANSRRYAEMVRSLSRHSQLIVITHNRTTMEAAHELYGVTMGSDGISKLLSVKFDEAVQVAK